ncbi:MAG: hypothetical protein U0235_24930 [Polyangiaceae bacterium]
MSDETHAGAGAERPSRLREGAGDGAPTAPHATPADRTAAAPSGPARFWDPRRIRRALAVALVLSTGLHAIFSPWSLFPEKGLEVREVEGELSIAIDTEDDPTPPAPPPPPPPPPPAATDNPVTDGPGAKRDAGPKDSGPKDAAPKDAGPKDAARDVDMDGDSDGAVAEVLEAGPRDAASDAIALAEAGAIALGEDGGGAPGANGPRDPTSTIGAAGNVQADVPLVQLLVNVAEIRKNPVGAKMGPLLSAIPEWDSFIAGTNVDPIRDTEWIYMSGPSLYTKRTAKLAIIIRYSASDAVVDRALEIVSKKYASGGPFDAGVPGVRAMLGHADFAPRVFLRPQSHVLAVVPPDYAHTAAKILSKAKVSPKVRPGEAMRLTLKNPSRPFPFLPTTLKELRLWIVPHEDGSADVFGEADTQTPDEAEEAAKQIRRVIREQNSFGVQLVTKGLLNKAEAVPDGALVRIHVPATEEQIQSLFDFVSAYLGVGKK